MKISNIGLRMVACGAFVAVGLTIGSGAAHAALVEPTAGQCLSFAQIAVDEGETFAYELAEHGLDASGCPAAPPVVLGECVLGHNTVTSEHCYTEGYSDPKDRPAGYPIPAPAPAVDCDGDTDGTPCPPPAPTPAVDCDGDTDGTPCPETTVPATTVPAMVAGDASSGPVVAPESAVKGVVVANAAPAAPAKAANLSTPALAAAAAPAAATTAKSLPLTGGDITGIVLLALASLGIGGALLMADKRRRLAA